MPIYAYRCEACGYSHDALQKISDPALSVCPECKVSSLRKQVTAAGFQLKGSGWYVTDFRDSQKSKGAQTSAATSPAPAVESTAGEKPKSDVGATPASPTQPSGVSTSSSSETSE